MNPLFEHSYDNYQNCTVTNFLPLVENRSTSVKMISKVLRRELQNPILSQASKSFLLGGLHEMSSFKPKDITIACFRNWFSFEAYQM